MDSATQRGLKLKTFRHNGRVAQARRNGYCIFRAWFESAGCRVRQAIGHIGNLELHRTRTLEIEREFNSVRRDRTILQYPQLLSDLPFRDLFSVYGSFYH